MSSGATSINKTLNYILGFIFFVATLVIWFGGLTGWSAYLGLVSAGLAIALQDPLVNLAGWIFISVRKPFVVGDRIEIGGHRGDVIDLRLFQFSLIEIGNWVDADQSTGRIIHIPNGWVFKQTTANYTAGFKFIWDEIAGDGHLRERLAAGQGDPAGNRRARTPSSRTRRPPRRCAGPAAST